MRAGYGTYASEGRANPFALDWNKESDGSYKEHAVFHTLPQCRSLHVLDHELTAHRLEVMVAMVDPYGLSETLTLKYDFPNIDLLEKESNPIFARALGLMVLLSLVKPLSTCNKIFRKGQKLRSGVNDFEEVWGEATIFGSYAKLNEDGVGREMFGVWGDVRVRKFLAKLTWLQRMEGSLRVVGSVGAEYRPQCIPDLAFSEDEILSMNERWRPIDMDAPKSLLLTQSPFGFLGEELATRLNNDNVYVEAGHLQQASIPSKGRSVHFSHNLPAEHSKVIARNVYLHGDYLVDSMCAIIASWDCSDTLVRDSHANLHVDQSLFLDNEDTRTQSPVSYLQIMTHVLRGWRNKIVTIDEMIEKHYTRIGGMPSGRYEQTAAVHQELNYLMAIHLESENKQLTSFTYNDSRLHCIYKLTQLRPDTLISKMYKVDDLYLDTYTDRIGSTLKMHDLIEPLSHASGNGHFSLDKLLESLKFSRRPLFANEGDEFSEHYSYKQSLAEHILVCLAAGIPPAELEQLLKRARRSVADVAGWPPLFQEYLLRQDIAALPDKLAAITEPLMHQYQSLIEANIDTWTSPFNSSQQSSEPSAEE